MRWAPENVAWFARQGGWARELLPLATAHAMVASEGESAYQWPDPPQSYACRTGLWAVDTLGWGEDARLALANPQAAAEDAWRRYLEGEGDWLWSPVAGSRAVELLAVRLAGIADIATPVLVLEVDPATVWERRDLAALEMAAQRQRSHLGSIRFP